MTTPDARIHRLTRRMSTTITWPARYSNLRLSNQQSRHPVDEAQLIEAATAVLQDSAFSSAAISLAVVDDATIHELNRRYLDHDWPTDVLSFVLEDDGDHLEGEVILSADTAAAAAAEVGWPAADEQLLYVIHGMLHLVGYDDKSRGRRRAKCVRPRPATCGSSAVEPLPACTEPTAGEHRRAVLDRDCRPVGDVLVPRSRHARCTRSRATSSKKSAKRARRPSGSPTSCVTTKRVALGVEMVVALLVARHGVRRLACGRGRRFAVEHSQPWLVFRR